MIDIFSLIVIGLIVLLGIGAAWFLGSKREKEFPQETFSLIKQDIEAIRRELGDRLAETAQMTQKQYSESVKIVQEVTQRLAKLDETNKQVLDFSRQLENLQDTLKNPKQRGIFGEYLLETLLRNTFSPKYYQRQYRFKDGAVVDFALFVGEKIIPIDSKFSLDTYNRLVQEKDPHIREKLEKQFVQDLKVRIEETSKYIRPEEGTTDFAFMFIPAEGIYYDLVVNKIGAVKANTRDLLDYALLEKNVSIVSPNTFYVHLQGYAKIIRDYRIQEGIEEIRKNVVVLSRHLKAYEDYMLKLGNQLATTVRTYNTASKEFGKIDKDITRLTGESPALDIPQIDKPQEE